MEGHVLLQEELKVSLDSTEADSIKLVAIENLKKAHEGMMIWMRGFGNSFTAEQISTGLAKNFDTEEAKQEAQELLQTMKIQKATAEEMRKAIDSSIADAEGILENTNP